MKKKKFFITGGLGLIGSNIVIKLVNIGHDVTILDNFSTGNKSNIPREILRKVKIYKSDLLNEKLLIKCISNADLIIHLAAFVGVKNILENKIASIETNTLGTEKILKISSKFNKKIILASTSEVFGKNINKSLSEEDNFILGNSHTFRWSYAAGKILDEFLAQAYIYEKKLDVLIVRFFNTVGPKQLSSYGMVIPRFIKSAIKNKNIQVYGNGKQTRTFLHVDDATDALLKLINKNYYKDVVHIGGVENISILNLAKKIKKITKSKSKIKLIKYSHAYSSSKKFSKAYEDIPKRHPSIKKLKKLINFKPKYNLDKLLIDIINYHKND